jgi:hypothetical protein
MENSALSVFAELGQKLKDDYFGLAPLFHSDANGFVISITEKGVTFTANASAHEGYVFVSVLENDNCTISMSNKFDASTGEPTSMDWLAYAEDCLHKYKNADHRAILKKIAAAASERASQLDNAYREANERINDLTNQ